MTSSPDQPWIKHDGMGCPLAVGTKVEIRNRAGALGLVTINTMSFCTSQWLDSGDLFTNAWAWAVNDRHEGLSGYDIVGYRVIKPSANEALEARTAMFNSWLTPQGVPEYEDA